MLGSPLASVWIIDLFHQALLPLRAGVSIPLGKYYERPSEESTTQVLQTITHIIRNQAS